MKRVSQVLPNRHAWHSHRTQSALSSAHGTQLFTISQLAARLAGGFLQPIDTDDFKAAVAEAITQPLGELDGIKNLPGFQRAAAGTLHKVWEAGLDLSNHEKSESEKDAKQRFASLARLEREVTARLPKNQLRPFDLVAAALKRVDHCEKIFGGMELRGFTELAPVWRPLLEALSKRISVVWVAEAREHPAWLPTTITVRNSAPAKPKIRAVSCANPRHEILEALRWARNLLTRGVSPQDIAIAATGPDTWDDYVLGFKQASGLPIHFVHGVSALSTSEGQLAAALSEILLRGTSPDHLIRLIALLRTQSSRFAGLPKDWIRAFPETAVMLDGDRWGRALSQLKPEDFSDHVNHAPELSEILAALRKGICEAGQIGERLLEKRALSIWHTALAEGAAGALPETLASLRLEDGIDSGEAIIWAPAWAVASVPRAYTWLVGLTSQSWPRRMGEDALLPGHILIPDQLTPLPVHLADRRDFESIRNMTTLEWVCSRARRESEGRQYGISSLFPRSVPEERFAQSREAEFAVNESDRLLARPGDFSKLPAARSAIGAWSNQQNHKLTAHDGLIRKNHPLLAKALDRTQSSSSLVQLLRDPIGYLWKYGFGWKEPKDSEQPLTLDALETGTLLHEVLDAAVVQLEGKKFGGYADATPAKIKQAIKEAIKQVRLAWEGDRPIPPPFIWNLKLEEVAAMASRALLFNSDPLPGQRSWTEIPFGGDWKAKQLDPKTLANLPWDPMQVVSIPGTKTRIYGSMDRLDLAGDRGSARVTDYKSGMPKKTPGQLNGGAEIQRCLYAFAVKALVSKSLSIEAQLLFPRDEAKAMLLANPAESMDKLAGYIKVATQSFLAGNALPGPGTADDYNGLAFALPAGATERYLPLKDRALADALAGLKPLWEEA